MIFNKMRLLLLFCLAVLFNACAVTGPVDDGFERDNEWVDNGRLGSDEWKTFSLPGVFGADKSSAEKQANITGSDEKTEFEQFKIWQKLRTEGEKSNEYQEFLQWLNFQKFKSSQQ